MVQYIPREKRVFKLWSKNEIGDEFHYFFLFVMIQLYPYQELRNKARVIVFVAE